MPKGEIKMSKKLLIGAGIVLLLAAAGVMAYVLRPTPEASAPIEAVPLNARGKVDRVALVERLAES